MEFLKSTALFSDCQQYRFHLSRVWDESKPSICWILLNPSTADAEKLDPTLTRCLNFSIRCGYGQMHVVNIFAFRATNPKNMMAAKDPIGDNLQMGELRVWNDGYLSLIPGICDMTVAGWGAGGEFNERWKDVKKIAELRGIKLHCLGKTKSGQPRHPLYMPNNSELKEWL